MSSDAETGRVNGRVFANLGRARLERALDAVETYFGGEWIAANPTHPVGQLWLLKGDFLATNELFWLGEAIVTLASLDAKWVRDVVEHIKSADRGRRVGYTFELLSLASIAGYGQTVHPAPRGNKTFDGDAVLTDGNKYKVSVKNFGGSDRDQRFQERSKAIEALVVAEAKRQGKTWIAMMIGAEAYPEAQEWGSLEAALPALIAQERPLSDGFWAVVFQKSPPQTNNPLDTENLSYSLLIAAKYHQNEVTGYVNKVISACTELDHAAATLGANERCIALIRVSEKAPISILADELQRFVNEERRRMFGAVIYQSAVAVTKEDTTAIHHNIKLVIRDGQTGMNIRYEVPVGVVSANPSRHIIKIDGKELPADGYHVYSRQKIYEAFHMTGQGRSGTFGAQPGSDHIAVMIAPDGQRLTWSMAHGDHREIILFS